MWRNAEQPSKKVHVVPLEDSGSHVQSMSCRCRPYISAIDEDVIVHNSFDGREFFEEGERKQGQPTAH